MADEGNRTFSREFKLAVLERMEAGENVSALARELGIRRKCLYQWRERYRLGGAIALRSRGRMTKAEALAMRSAGGVAPATAKASAADPVRLPPPPDALTKAQRRIAELERKIGQQQVDLDFFQQALRHVREMRQRSGAPGGTASMRSSKR
jgi:transposase